jgi:MFS family permease
VWGIVFGIGLGFGPIIGAGIVALLNWTWVFLVHGLISALTLILTYRGVQESRDSQRRQLDLAGIFFLSVAVFGLTYFITQGPAAGFDRPVAVASMAAAVICFGVFVIIELRRAAPMFDFAVFRIRDFSGALFGSMGMNFSFWPFMIYLPLYFQNALGYGGVATGWSLLAYTLPTLVAPPLGERLALRFHPARVIPGGLFTIGLGFMVMRWGSGVAGASWLTLLPGCAIAGLGLGVTNTPVTNTTTAAVTSDRAGMASGIDMSVRLITLAINIALMGFILVQGIRMHLRAALPANVSTERIHEMAEHIAAGTFDAADSAVVFGPNSPALAQQALVHGFRGVMLYAGTGVWLLAVLSWLTFGPDMRAARSSKK